MYILKSLSKSIIFCYILDKTMYEVKDNRNMHFLLFI